MNYTNMYLHLDQEFKPYEGTEIVFETFTFPGGEPHIKINTELSGRKVVVTHRINSFNDFGLLLMAIDALKRMYVENIEVFIPYFPAARQDRLMVKGEPLSVKVYAEIINATLVNRITIFDPHSDVAPALLNNCTRINNHKFISNVIKELPNNLLLVSPDGGAAKKINKLAFALQNYQVLQCGKTRDITSGALSGFTVPLNDLQERPCLIVDDICDGGGTFLGLGKELKKKNAGDLYLAVSHGIFSKGLDNLKQLFNAIYTTDSISNYNADQLNQIPLKEIINE